MIRPFRIAMVAACPFPWPRGTPIRILRMAEVLAARGHEVHVVTYHHGRDDDRSIDTLHIHRTRKVPFCGKYAPGPTYGKLFLLDPLLARLLGRVIHRRGIDVVHAHHYEGLLAGAFAVRRTKLPLVYDAHTLLESELPSYGLGLPRRVKRALGRAIDERLPPMANHVVSVTARIREKLIAMGRIDEGAVTVVPNGVEFDRFAAISPAGGGKDRSNRLVFAGNLAPYQGIEKMLAALRDVARAVPGVRLRLVTNSSFAPYERLARELGVRRAVELIPSSFADLPRQLSEAAVALNPRTGCDGIPQKLLNYMAAGLPTVSFESSAPCVDHGKTGWVAPDGDTAAFAAGIVRLLGDGDLAGRLGAGGREFVRTRHTWEESAAALERIYDDLTGGDAR